MDFSIQRLGILLIKDFRELLLKSVGIIALIFFVITVFNLAGAYFDNGGHRYEIFINFITTALISCSIIGSITFEEINKRPKRIEYLNLPGSAEEKTLSKLISVGIIFPICLILIYFISYGFANIVNSIILDGRLHLNTNMELSVLQFWTIGSIITSIFVYGSIKYNTGSYIKIGIWGLTLFLAFAAISFVIAFIIFPELRALIFNQSDPGLIHMNNNGNDIENFWVIRFVKNLFYFVPLIFWVLTYFTLKEKEA